MAGPKYRDSFQSVDHYQVVEGLGILGATEKDVLQDPDTGKRYIAKLGGRHNDLEVMTEYAIYVVGRSLGVSVAGAMIGRFRGQLRFLSEYFLDERSELVHGMQLFTQLHDEHTVSRVLKNELSEQALFSVQAIKAAFGAHYLHCGSEVEDALFGGLIGMLAHDALIGVQDRHHENWGVIVHRELGGEAPRFAPLYDSARGLFCNATDQHLTKYFGPVGSQRLDRYVEKSRPLIGFDGLTPAAGRSFITHAELLAAVFEAYPAERKRISSILEAYDWKLVRSDIRAELFDLCHPRRLTLILSCLRRRIRSLWRRIHGSDGPADILKSG